MLPLLARSDAHGAVYPVRATWTVHHFLTITMDTDWDELRVPYIDPSNGEIEMDRAPDRCRYVLGRLIAEGTGRTVHDFPREALFDRQGLGPSEWLVDATGNAFAASDLRLRPRDLATAGKRQRARSVGVAAARAARSSSGECDLLSRHYRT